MTHRETGGEGDTENVKPVQQQSEGTQDDDEGGKETIPDADVPGSGENG